MKKTIAIVACAAAMLLAGKANAQLGINVGYAPVTLTKATTYNGETSITSSEMDGFFGGVTYNYGLNKGLGLAFGLQGRYNTVTTTKSEYIPYLYQNNEEYTTTQFLLDVPVLLNYSFDLNRSAKLKVFAGPTFSYALKGNTHVTKSTSVGTAQYNPDDKDYDMYGDNSHNKRFDVTAAFGLELQYNAIRIFGGYRMGLSDLDTRDNVKTTSSGIFAGLGYCL